MDGRGQQGAGRQMYDNFREERPVWNAINHRHMREQSVWSINRKLLSIIAERDAAIEERNRALFEKKKAMEEREAAIALRNYAIRERDDAIIERDNAFSALEQSFSHPATGVKRLPYNSGSPSSTIEMQILNDLCTTVAASKCRKSLQVKRRNDNKGCGSSAMKPRKGEIMGEDLNRPSGTDQLKLRNDLNGQNQNRGLNRLDFDESIMPIPGCSCTGVFRHCYKWGNGGWQSSCCTTIISQYPLPLVPNKRYTRMSGRKMSGSAFSKLLTRLAIQGYDFSVPVNLKDHWSKHGTNRYITIK